ncbi:lysozyme inhibitor LprI family protein [Cupriavidus sp. AcVe19-6a]|uniref:lysozyme inhibitor LprI family protein n=1 Tax=Cupriavidus sp. AcVe19-6a TaxID=2821358 RepID=UPI001AEB5E5E|nr:lysozyme inhibitor LprI family protein [Cupriavidus sp. AcVe19-6a]MBP0635913.1 hypothetical protein [Cupriavidus sp. AcVe19-6a]
MKKIIATLILAAAATQASAYVDICNMKRSQSEQMQCYQYGASGGMMRLKKNYERTLNSNNVTESEKKNLRDNQKKWEAAVDRKCSDNVCVYHAVAQRNEDLQQFMQNHGLQSM